MKNKLYLLGAFLFGLLLLSSCSKDDNSSGNDGKIDPSTVAATNLIAYFSFDAEPAANAAVDKTNGSITYTKKVGPGAFVPGRRGNAYQGNALQSYLEYAVGTGTALKTLDEFSLACWIKTPVTTSGACKIFTINGGDSFMGALALMQESQALGDSVDMKFYLFDSASPAWKGQDIRKNKTAFLNDKWFHLVALYRKATSTMEFFANGKLVYSAVKYADAAPAGGGAQPLLEGVTLGSDMTKIHFGAWTQQIAGAPESWMTYYKGMVDEFRIYNKALSEAEVQSLYDAEITQINP